MKPATWRGRFPLVTCVFSAAIKLKVYICICIYIYICVIYIHICGAAILYIYTYVHTCSAKNHYLHAHFSAPTSCMALPPAPLDSRGLDSEKTEQLCATASELSGKRPGAAASARGRLPRGLDGICEANWASGLRKGSGAGRSKPTKSLMKVNLLWVRWF